MNRIARHYAPRTLAGALASTDDPSVHQLHLGGLEATRALIRLAGFPADASVLDIGGGTGGPARVLAADTGARVTVVDLTEAFCRVGETIARRQGLEGRVAFRHADATALPFPDASFDGAWTVHSTMNVDDKERLFGEARRVMRSAGRLAVYEICQGPVRPLRFPVPWASDLSLSFLRPPEDLRALIARSGFREVAWEDVTAALRAKAGAGPSPALRLLFGEDQARRMADALRSNLDEDRLRVVRGLWNAVP